MKKIITDFDLNIPNLQVGHVTAFADTVIARLTTLANEHFEDGITLKFPYAKDCIEQIETIKAALTPIAASAATSGGMKKPRQSRRSRSRNRNRSKSARRRSKRR
jgi:hypothetical protein